MTDTAGVKPPFPGFPGFPPAEMLDKMWDVMRLTPFGAAFPGMQPGSAQGFGAPLAAMSDMMAPLMNVEELDKRITDLRAVEQWLKLNVNMLQSAIQGLEVQRATLSTLHAFGAFAQASMTQPAEGAGSAHTHKPSPWSSSTSASPSRSSEASTSESSSADTADEAEGSTAQGSGAGSAAFDPSSWWNLLQSQFNQLASFAMTQPGMPGGEANANVASSNKADAADAQDAKEAGEAVAPASKPAAKRAPARKSGAKPASGSTSGAARGQK